jgi:hypothetical protein
MIAGNRGVCWERRCVYDDTDLWCSNSEANTWSPCAEVMIWRMGLQAPGSCRLGWRCVGFCGLEPGDPDDSEATRRPSSIVPI